MGAVEPPLGAAEAIMASAGPLGGVRPWRWRSNKKGSVAHHPSVYTRFPSPWQEVGHVTPDDRACLEGSCGGERAARGIASSPHSLQGGYSVLGILRSTVGGDWPHRPQNGGSHFWAPVRGRPLLGRTPRRQRRKVVELEARLAGPLGQDDRSVCNSAGRLERGARAGCARLVLVQGADSMGVVVIVAAIMSGRVGKGHQRGGISHQATGLDKHRKDREIISKSKRAPAPCRRSHGVIGRQPAPAVRTHTHPGATCSGASHRPAAGAATAPGLGGSAVACLPSGPRGRAGRNGHTAALRVPWAGRSSAWARHVWQKKLGPVLAKTASCCSSLTRHGAIRRTLGAKMSATCTSHSLGPRSAVGAIGVARRDGDDSHGLVLPWSLRGWGSGHQGGGSGKRT